MFALNPYIAGNPIRAEQNFFGREDIFREVSQVLNHPKSNAIVLYGQRRIGKTSVLLQLEKKLLQEGRFTPVYFDLQDKAGKLLPELLYELASCISTVIGQVTPDRSLFDESGNFFKAKFLPEVSKNTSEGGLVLLFDEFDVLDSPKLEKASQSFFPYLRKWMAEIESVQFVFVIGRRPEDLSISTLLTFKGVRATRISLINRASTEALIRQSEKEDSLRWNDRAIERLWEICQGHPYFTQLLCSVVFENAHDEDPTETPEVNESKVDKATDEALQQGANSFNWIWNGLPPAERIVMSAMAEAKDLVITQEELINILNRSGVRLIVRQLELAPEILVEWELLKQVDRGYSFVVPLFNHWVANHRPLRRVKEELDRLDPLAETLFQAGQIYYSSHQLTEAENQVRQSLKINPNHLKSRLLLGRILFEDDRAEESVAVLEEAYKYDASAARSDLIKALLAIAKNSEQDESKLISCYQRIITIDKNQSLAKDRLEKILRKQHLQKLKAKLAEEKFSYRKKLLLKYGPISVFVLGLLGILLFRSSSLFLYNTPPSEFATKYCQNKETLNSDTRHTVEKILETVDINDCQKAADQLVLLNKLSLNRENIVDLSPLSSLTNLKELDLENNPINNIEALSLLKNLQRLNLRSNNIQDLTPISQLKGLNDLELSSNGLENLSNIEFTEKLEQLRLENNYIKDITPLASLKQLKLLDISNNRIEDITAIAELDNLETLHLNNNAIKNIQVLENMRYLKYLDLNNNQLGRVSLDVINQLEYLKQLTNLTYLDLHDNNISDLSPLKSLVELRHFKASQNEIDDLSPLVTMKELKILILFDNEIEDISPLEKLTNIEELYLSNNQINNFEFLKDFNNLRKLNVRNNSIENKTCPVESLSLQLCEF